MITFDDEETARLVKKHAISLNLSYVFFSVTLVTAIIAAALSKGAYTDGANRIWYITSLIIAIASLLGFIILVAGVRVYESRQLNFAVCSAIAEGLLAREDFLKGGEELEFVVEYSREWLTLSREGYTGEITIDPSHINTLPNLDKAGSEIAFDLSPLTKLPSVYATIGTKLWQFLQAYYFVKGAENGVKRVTITDLMGKNPTKLVAFDESAPTKNTDKNYFIKKGLIK